MRIRIVLAFLVFSICFVSAQNAFPTKKELFGKWVVTSDFYDSNKIYLVDSEVYRSPNKSGIEFFVGKFTGKSRIRYFQVYKNNKRPRNCGHSSSPHQGSRIGVNQSIWDYKTSTGILTVVHPRYSSSTTVFKVEKESSSELILTKI